MNKPVYFAGVDLARGVDADRFRVMSNGEDITHECTIGADGVVWLGERFMIEDVPYEDVTPKKLL